MNSTGAGSYLNPLLAVSYWAVYCGEAPPWRRDVRFGAYVMREKQPSEARLDRNPSPGWQAPRYFVVFLFLNLCL